MEKFADLFVIILQAYRFLWDCPHGGRKGTSDKVRNSELFLIDSFLIVMFGNCWHALEAGQTAAINVITTYRKLY